MCYDISFKTQLREIKEYFPELEEDPQLNVEWPQYDHLQGVEAFPKIPIIFRDPNDKKLRLRVMEWGLIRNYATEEPSSQDRNFMLNAMSEKIFGDKNSYWYKIKRNICLIPLTGTYEHRGVLKFTKKVPYFIKPKSQKVFFVPGLFSATELPDKNTGEMKWKWTFTLETREPSVGSVMRNIHNDSKRGFRMALYQTFQNAKDLIAENLTDERYKEIIGYEMPSEDLEYYPVWTIRTRSGNGRPDGKQKDEYFEWAKLPPLGEANPV